MRIRIGHFAKEDIGIANNHMKIYSVSLVIRDANRIVIKYHIISTIIAKFKFENTKHDKITEQPTASFFGIVKRYNHFGKLFSYSYKVKQTILLRKSNSIPKYLLKIK